MRTVSFSDRRVQELLNNRFVCTFTNTEGDPTAGQSISHSPNDPPGPCIQGNGKQNVQTIFMTPDGEIFHVATGFQPPEVLAQEIRFAANLYGQMRDGEVDPFEVVRTAHIDRLRDLGFNDQQINADRGFEMFVTMPGMGKNGQTIGFDNNGLFDDFVRRQVLSDNQFPIRHPLMSWQQLQRDPTPLVGNGTSFFASSSSGGSR